jgi:hypothetical protein
MVELTQLSEDVYGVHLRARPRLRRHDFRDVSSQLPRNVVRGQRPSLLCRIEDDVRPGALVRDLASSVRFLSEFRRCALIGSRHGAALTAGVIARLLRAILPLDVKVYSLPQESAALRWLESEPRVHGLPHELLDEPGILVAEPKTPLDVEDFDVLQAEVDPWILRHGMLQGVVVQFGQFSGWNRAGSFVRQVQFLRAHRTKVRRLAWIGAPQMLEPAFTLARPWLRTPELKCFPRDQRDRAISWVQAGEI